MSLRGKEENIIEGNVMCGVALVVWGSNLCPTTLNMPLAISPGS